MNRKAKELATPKSFGPDIDRRRVLQGTAGIAAALVGHQAVSMATATPARAQGLLHIAAAIQWPGNKAQFFLNDGRYVRYDMRADAMDPGYPKPITDTTWPGMAPYARHIAAACNGPRGKAYLFLSNGRYLRYDIEADEADPGYPKEISDTTWPGLARHAFALASALNWKDNKIQFFLKNGQYIRYDIAADRADEGYPKAIDEASWPGLASHKDNLAGMINWGNGKAYMFFTDNRYLRYDIQADRIDPGYPKPLNDQNWPGLGDVFRSR